MWRSYRIHRSSVIRAVSRSEIVDLEAARASRSTMIWPRYSSMVIDSFFIDFSCRLSQRILPSEPDAYIFSSVVQTAVDVVKLAIWGSIVGIRMSWSCLTAREDSRETLPPAYSNNSSPRSIAVNCACHSNLFDQVSHTWCSSHEWAISGLVWSLPVRRWFRRHWANRSEIVQLATDLKNRQKKSIAISTIVWRGEKKLPITGTVVTKGGIEDRTRWC